jgi:hypothetical protein
LGGVTNSSRRSKSAASRGRLYFAWGCFRYFCFPQSQKFSDFQNILIYRISNQRYISRHPAPLGGALRNVNNAERAAMAVEDALDKSA